MEVQTVFANPRPFSISETSQLCPGSVIRPCPLSFRCHMVTCHKGGDLQMDKGLAVTEAGDYEEVRRGSGFRRRCQAL